MADHVDTAAVEAASDEVGLQITKVTGRKTYRVGGWVRDKHLPGAMPKDADIITGATPDQVQQAWPEAVLDTIPYPRYIVVRNGHEIEIASIRGYKPGVSWSIFPPPVLTGLPEEEALHLNAIQRDFTMNGLYETVGSGEIIDPVGGLADLKAGIIRCMADPELTLGMMTIRMTRAIRFACQFGFTLDAEIVPCIKRNVHKYACVHCEDFGHPYCPHHKHVQVETLLHAPWSFTRDELLNTLASKQPARGVKLLRETGLLRYIVPELKNPIGGWARVEANLQAACGASKTDMLAMLLAPCLKRNPDRRAVVARIAKRLKLTDKQTTLVDEKVQKLVRAGRKTVRSRVRKAAS